MNSGARLSGTQICTGLRPWALRRSRWACTLCADDRSAATTRHVTCNAGFVHRWSPATRKRGERRGHAEIADAAEVSPRTIFAYFPSKEDILFCDLPETQERLAQALRERPDGATAVDALREFIAGSLGLDRNDLLRKGIVASNEVLSRSQRARFAPLEELIVDAVIEDLDAGPGDIRPQIVAAALGAAFNVIHDRDPATPESFDPDQAMAVIDDVMDSLRGGLEALRNQ